MNADLKRVRENSLDGGSSPSSSKRRALGSPNSGAASPRAATEDDAQKDDTQLEEWVRDMESKRKLGIYRQMLEYSRSYDRERVRAHELERQRRALEASLRSVERCWEQLVDSLQEKAGRPADLQVAELLDSNIDPSIPQSELDSALESRLSATLRLVSVFTELASGGKVSAELGGELAKKLAKVQAEASSLRTNSDLLQTQIDQLRQARDTYQLDLQRAEKRLDRQRMNFDLERTAWEAKAKREASSTPAQPIANGSGHSTPNAPRGGEEGVAPGPSPAETAETEERIAQAEALAASRLSQLETLRAEHTGLKQEVDKLRLQAHHPTEAQLRESPFFQVYLQRLSTQVSRADALQSRFDSSETKLDQLRDSNLEFREAVQQEARQEVETLRQQMSKRDTDLARLRAERDKLNDELHERKQTESLKSNQSKVLDDLCKKREDRITHLQSEVGRLKGQAAAEAGASGYLKFLHGEGGIDGDYVKDLEAKLAAAHDQVTALTAQIETASGGDAAAAAAETTVRVELEAAKRSLSKFERILGPEALADVKELGDKLRQATEAEDKLKLQLSQAEESTNALYAEVEGLSSAWDGLEKTLKDKVYDLRDAENNVKRLATEKAKADNKFFDAMRMRDAVEAELKNTQRVVDKQTKLLEKGQETEKAMTVQVAAQDKALTTLKNSSLDLQTQVAAVSSERRQLELRLQQSQGQLSEAQQLLHQRVAEAAAASQARTKAEEELEAAQRQVKKSKEKLEALTAAGAAGNMSVGEAHIREEREKLLKLLRCSTCHLNFKQQVLIKCMHTFCKDCIDQRIATRQRKCPACGVAFSKEDVGTLYWQ
ncbi:E3 ubiquitin-protein ligase bre1 [Vanrija albida]|uniref:E3 ubiquitin protein ligase n=1 Tax=Vanrija albida TaxID=181172 RepID=A0ABR3QCC8_9TREE